MNILGSEYSIISRTEDEDIRLKDKWAYVDWTEKTIVILKEEQRAEDSLKHMELFKQKVLRHEIIHAFFIESGLHENCEYAINEELIDWIAIQFPKMVKVFQEIDVI